MIAVYLIMAGASIWASRRGYHFPVLGGLWLFLSLVPVLNIFPTSPVVADRYAYFAVMGFGMIFSSILEILRKKRKGIVYGAIIISFVMSFINIERNRDWRSDITLWESALKVDPDIDSSNLASALWNNGKYEKALAYFMKERDRRGSYLYNLYYGRYLYLIEKYEESVSYFRKAIAEGSGALKEANLYVAEAYEKTGNIELALKYYLRVFNVKSIFYSRVNNLDYLPVRDMTLAVDAQFWGMKPFGFQYQTFFFI